jgi:DNA-binding GntR family transcriptional regulator
MAEPEGMERVLANPRAPYEQIAVDLRGAILNGKYSVGEPLPTIKQLMATYNVATGTAHRAISLLADWGLVNVSRGQRATVRVSAPSAAESIQLQAASAASDNGGGEITTKTASKLWEITLRGSDGRRYPRRHVCADIDQPDLFRGHLL